MQITVRLFASFADKLGGSHVTLSLPEPVTVADVRGALVALSPELPPHPLVAVNASYAHDAVLVTERDEVAAIPPVAGG